MNRDGEGRFESPRGFGRERSVYREVYSPYSIPLKHVFFIVVKISLREAKTKPGFDISG